MKGTNEQSAMAGAPALFAPYQNCCRALSQDLTPTQFEQRVVFLVLAVASGAATIGHLAGRLHRQ